MELSATRCPPNAIIKSVSLLGLIMEAKGLRGQGERVSQMLVSRIPLAAERKPSISSVNQCPSVAKQKNSVTSRKSASPVRDGQAIKKLCVLSGKVFHIEKPGKKE